MRESQGDKMRKLQAYRDQANAAIQQLAALLEIAIKAVEAFASRAPAESPVRQLAAFLRTEQGKMLGIEPEAAEGVAECATQSAETHTSDLATETDGVKE